MKKESKKRMKGNKGITLIALVVTIVVLLILAGITISTLFGDNGIILAARKAADDTKRVEEDTSKEIENLANDLNSVLNSENNKIVEPKNIEDWIYEKDETTNTITILRYKGKDTEVVIPNSIGGVKVKSIGINDAGEGCDTFWDDSIRTKTIETYTYKQETITSVIVSEGIEIIGTNCFTDSVNLKKVQISDTVKKICSYAFFGCVSLNNINIPNGVISLGENGNPANGSIIGGVFTGCKSLTNITIPSSVTTMEECIFGGIPSITVNVPFKEGNRPSGWASNWNYNYNGTITVQYIQ